MSGGVNGRKTTSISARGCALRVKNDGGGGI